MTALRLRSNELGPTGKTGSNRRFGLRKAEMGPLEQSRLQTVLKQAEKAGIKGSIPDTLRDPRLASLVARKFKVPTPGADVCLRYYHQHVDSYREADRYVGRQIVLRCATDDPMARAEAWARAERLVAILYFDPRMFDDLLATYDPIAEKTAGRVGPVIRGVLPAELEGALLALRPGQICPVPVATDSGIHVVLLDQIFAGQVPSFALMHARISATLRQLWRSQAATRHLSRLAERYLASLQEL